MGLFADLGKMSYQEGIDQRALGAANLREDEQAKRAAELERQRREALQRALTGEGGQPQQKVGPAGAGGQDETVPEPQGQSMLSPGEQPAAGTQGGLLANPYDANVVANFRQQGMLSGMKDADIDSYIADAQQSSDRVGDFSTRKEQLEANSNFADDYKKEIQPYFDRVQFYDDTTALGPVENWTGTDDFMAMRNLLKQSLPNESVMGDDLGNLTTSGGLPGWATEMVAKLQGKGAQGATARRNLMNTMHKNAKQARSYGDDIRGKYTTRAEKVNGLNTDYILKPRDIKAPVSLKQPGPQTPKLTAKAEKEALAAEMKKRGLLKKKTRGQMGRSKKNK